MVKWKVVIIAIFLPLLFYILLYFGLPLFGISIETGPFFTYILIFTAIVLAISAFLPRWSKILREIFYIGLFICILFLELSIFNTAFTTLKPPEVTLEKCTTLFGTKEKPTEAWDAIAVWSCITAGHFPATYSNLGWTVFFIFYLLLPFAFIWTLLYGLMKGIDLGALFGGFAGTATTLLSFIIAMYAARQLFGFFLLDFYGYGAWGIAGVFGAALFVLFLRKIIEDWFKIEEKAETTRRVLGIEEERERAVLPLLRHFLDRIERSPPDVRTELGMQLTDSNTLYYKELTGQLTPARRDEFIRALQIGDFRRAREILR